ncbi:protein phosphatase 2C domain-containing protein [Nocardia sp. NPDC005978]|uniref:PP2C family protein-serine/threonine phosphatase n=1 Tax=Nocardia sp. NPDC005978 TaxID=3156725 RepID=UPI0033B61C91
MQNAAVEIGVVPIEPGEGARLGRVSGSAVSRVGGRKLNADSFATVTDSALGRTAFAVADGVGDHLAAARAARLVARTAARIALTHGAQAGILAAQEELLRELPEAAADSVLVVAVLPAEGHPDGPIDIAWVGDCRAYRWNGRILHQITTDHTVAEYFRARGHQPLPGMGHLVTTSARTAHAEDIGSAATGTSLGRLLLCTDGVSKRLELTDIKALLAEPNTPAEAAESLVAAALAAGGTDNATAMVLDIGAAPA